MSEEKTIEIFCPDCHEVHSLADNGWTAIICTKCGREIKYPKNPHYKDLSITWDGSYCTIRCDKCKYSHTYLVLKDFEWKQFCEDAEAILEDCCGEWEGNEWSYLKK